VPIENTAALIRRPNCPLRYPHLLQAGQNSVTAASVLTVWRNQTRFAWKILIRTESAIHPMTTLETLNSDDMSVLRGLVIDHVHRKYGCPKPPGFPEEIKDLYRADADNLLAYIATSAAGCRSPSCVQAPCERPRGLSGLWLQDALLKEGSPGVPHDTTDTDRALAEKFHRDRNLSAPSETIIRKHYFNRVSSDDSRKFWQIVPAA
jgi:hypothetical protein